MNKKILPALVLLAFGSLVLFFSCSKTINSSTDPTAQYYPIKLGHYVVYHVDSTIYIDTNCKTRMATSQIRYSFSDTFRDGQKRLSYIVNVQSRPNNDAAKWTSQGVIFVTPTGSSIELSQRNLDFIKLTFPVQNGHSWNGTSLVESNDSAYMFMRSWNYQYQNVGQSYNNGFVNFSNTATVLERDSAVINTHNNATVPYLYRDYYKEIYAMGVGMVYSEMTHLTYDSIKSPCQGGYSVIMRAVEHN